MAEIKTCEHYVVNRLQEVENEAAENYIKYQEAMIAKDRLEREHNALLDILKRHTEARRSGSSSCYYSFSVWNCYSSEKEDFKVLDAILKGFEEEETKEEEEEDASVSN